MWRTLAALLAAALAMPALALLGWWWGRWTPSVALVTAALGLTFIPLLTHRLLGEPLAPLTGSWAVTGGLAVVLALLVLLPFAPTLSAGLLLLAIAVVALLAWRRRRHRNHLLVYRETNA